MVNALGALVSPMNAYLDAYAKYIPLINTNVEQALGEWEAKMSAQADISGVIPIVRRHLDAARELTGAMSITECVGVFSINSAGIRDALVRRVRLAAVHQHAARARARSVRAPPSSAGGPPPAYGDRPPVQHRQVDDRADGGCARDGVRGAHAPAAAHHGDRGAAGCTARGAGAPGRAGCDARAQDLVDVLAYMASVPKVVQKQVRCRQHFVRPPLRARAGVSDSAQRLRANALLKMASSLDEFRYRRQRDGMTALFTAIIYINDLLTAVEGLTKTAGARRADLATEMLAQQVAFLEELEKIGAEVKTFDSVESTKNSKELVLQVRRPECAARPGIAFAYWGRVGNCIRECAARPAAGGRAGPADQRGGGAGAWV